MRKIKATQKMDARGVCMLWVVSVISGGWEIAASLYQKNAYNGFQSETPANTAKRKKDSRRTQNGTRPKTKRHKHPKRHSEGTCGAITIKISIQRFSVVDQSELMPQAQ